MFSYSAFAIRLVLLQEVRIFFMIRTFMCDFRHYCFVGKLETAAHIVWVAKIQSKIQPVVSLELVSTLPRGLSANGLVPGGKWRQREAIGMWIEEQRCKPNNHKALCSIPPLQFTVVEVEVCRPISAPLSDCLLNPNSIKKYLCV